MVHFSDAFTVAVNTPLENHTPTDAGDGWVKLYDTASTTAIIAKVSPQGGGATPTVGPAVNENSVTLRYAITPDPPGADYDISCEFHHSNWALTNTYLRGILGRWHEDGEYPDGAGTWGYIVVIRQNAHSAASIELRIVTGGVSAFLGAYDHTFVNGDVVTLSMRDTVIAVLVNGVEVISAEDDWITVPGKAGLFWGAMPGLSGHVDRRCEVDNYVVTMAGGEPPPPALQVSLSTAKALASSAGVGVYAPAEPGTIMPIQIKTLAGDPIVSQAGDPVVIDVQGLFVPLDPASAAAWAVGPAVLLGAVNVSISAAKARALLVPPAVTLGPISTLLSIAQARAASAPLTARLGAISLPLEAAAAWARGAGVDVTLPDVPLEVLLGVGQARVNPLATSVRLGGIDVALGAAQARAKNGPFLFALGPIRFQGGIGYAKVSAQKPSVVLGGLNVFLGKGQAWARAYYAGPILVPLGSARALIRGLPPTVPLVLPLGSARLRAGLVGQLVQYGGVSLPLVAASARFQAQGVTALLGPLAVMPGALRASPGSAGANVLLGPLSIPLGASRGALRALALLILQGQAPVGDDAAELVLVYRPHLITEALGLDVREVYRPADMRIDADPMVLVDDLDAQVRMVLERALVGIDLDRLAVLVNAITWE